MECITRYSRKIHWLYTQFSTQFIGPSSRIRTSAGRTQPTDIRTSTSTPFAYSSVIIAGSPRIRKFEITQTERRKPSSFEHPATHSYAAVPSISITSPRSGFQHLRRFLLRISFRISVPAPENFQRQQSLPPFLHRACAVRVLVASGHVAIVCSFANKKNLFNLLPTRKLAYSFAFCVRVLLLITMTNELDLGSLKRRCSTLKASCTRVKTYVDTIASVMPAVTAQLEERKIKLE